MHVTYHLPIKEFALSIGIARIRISALQTYDWTRISKCCEATPPG